MRWCTSRRRWSGRDFSCRLLIGGATTSRAHTAVKIAPHYRASTVHVLDASRAVGVVSTLLNRGMRRRNSTQQTRADYERLREEHAAETREKKMLTLEQARANRTTDRLEQATSRRSRSFSELARFATTPRSAADSSSASRSTTLVRLHRLVAIFSHLGIARTLSGDFRRSDGRQTGARAFRRRAETPRANCQRKIC